jgi:hypothetical protein
MATNDPEFQQAAKYAPEAYQPRSQRGCFFYGCIIASILALLVVIAIGVATYLGYRFLNQLVEEYTSTTPRALPKVEMPDEQRQALKDRVEAFRKAVNAGASTEPLVLTSTDLNALIEEDPDLKGKIYIAIEGEKLKGQLSLPLEFLGLGMVKGRYLNGEADLKASLREGVLIVTLDSIEVNGKKPPEEMLTSLRQQNLAKDAYKNPEQAELLRKVESMEIKDGKIIIKVRPTGDNTKKLPPSDGVVPPDSAKPAPEPAPGAPPPAKPAPPAKAAPAAESPLPKA